MRKTLSLLGFTMALAACQSPPASVAASASDAEAARDDACRSRQFASLVGQDRSKAPTSTEGHPVRVVCSTCPMTMDYNPQRLNVVFDEKTGVVQKLNCG